MAEPSRGQWISRRGWLLAGLTAPLFRAWATDPIVTWDGDNLHVSPFGVHFLRGKSLQRLKEGSTIIYVVGLTLYRDAFVSAFRRTEFRFAVSYDVLGTADQFAVVNPGPPASRASNLSQSGTENWCLEHAGITSGGISKDMAFWLQLDLKIALPKLNGIGPGAFVDFLEALTPGNDEKQILRAGPLRLAELVRTGKGRAG